MNPELEKLLASIKAITDALASDTTAPSSNNFRGRSGTSPTSAPATRSDENLSCCKSWSSAAALPPVALVWGLL
jgi:hypothetical protein